MFFVFVFFLPFTHPLSSFSPLSTIPGFVVHHRADHSSPLPLQQRLHLPAREQRRYCRVRGKLDGGRPGVEARAQGNGGLASGGGAEQERREGDGGAEGRLL